MANVPTYTAQGVNVRPRTPSHIQAPESGLAEAGAGISQIGKVISEHAGYLQNQKDTIDFQFMRSQLDAGLENRKLDLHNDPEIYDTLVRVDNVNGNYDLHLKRNSPAIGTGNSDLAPTVDRTGRRRPLPIDIGAYARSE